MNNVQTVSILPEEFNKSVFTFYLILFGILSFSGLGYLLWKGKFLYLGLIASIPLVLLLVSRPKLAVGQYIFVLFISRSIVEGQPWLYADFSGFILIAAAMLDIVSESKLHKRLPRLSFNFLFLLVVIFTAGVFSYQPEAAIRPFGRIALLFLHFLALYKLSGKVSVAWSLNMFFGLSLIHSIIVLIPFIASGGTLRSFGLAPVIFDELAMLALVVAAAKFLWAEKRTAWIYLLGMVVIFFALLSTQSRAPIIIGAAMSILVILFSRRRARQELAKASSETGSISSKELLRVRKRPLHLLVGLLFSVMLVIILFPQLLAPLLERFESLLTARPSGSFLLRIVLWKLAWSLFIDNPLVGIGPGLFIQIQSVFPTIRLDVYHSYLRGLSAHNLLLHYLAEAGIIGGIAVLAMMLNQMRLSYKAWRASVLRPNFEVSAILLGIGATLLVTTLAESGWLWGQSSIIFVFFISLIARNHNNLIVTKNSGS